MTTTQRDKTHGTTQPSTTQPSTTGLPPTADPGRRPRAGSRWSILRRIRIGTPVRPDPVAVGLALLSLALSAGVVAVGLVYNKGRLVPPLDDVYIHLQYARQLGRGLGFAYTDGAAPSTGASSLLWVLVLGAASALGVGGTSFLAFAIAVGAVGMAGAVVTTYLTGRRIAGRRVATWAGLLVALSGPLLWGAASGMEVGLVAALASGSVLAFVREAPRRRFHGTPVVAALLALARPEGLILAVALVAGMLWTLARSAWSERPPPVLTVLRASATLLPLAAGTGQLLLYRLLTGTVQADGLRAKSLFHQQSQPQPTEVFDAVLRNLQQMLSTLTGLDAQDLVPPATGALVVIGLVALGVRPDHRWRTLAVALALGLGAVLASVATLRTAQWQNLRYLQPFLPLTLLLAVVGVDALGETLRTGSTTGRGTHAVTHGVLAVALLFSVVYVPTWALRYGQQAATIREAPVSVALWLRENLPPEGTVAVNDVGATGYLSGHRVTDLVGLTTDGLAAPANGGAGTLYEALRRLPPDERPDFFSIYDDWPGVPVGQLRDASILGPRPIRTFDLVSPPHPVDGFAPPPCQTDRSCSRVNVWRADWTVADSGAGDRPDVPPPGTIRDYVDVGDLASEAAHDWAAEAPMPGPQPRSVVTTAPTVTGTPVVASGRHVVGGDTFTLHHLEPGRPVVLTARVASPTPDDELGPTGRSPEVTADGRPVGTWPLPANPAGPWTQTSTTIPADAVRGPDLIIGTGPPRDDLAPYPDRTIYGVWASQ